MLRIFRISPVPHRLHYPVRRRLDIPLCNRLPRLHRYRVMRTHRRQEHHSLSILQPCTQHQLHVRYQPRTPLRILRLTQQLLIPKLTHRMTPLVQLIRTRLPHPIIRHRHRARPIAQQILRHRVVHVARQELVLRRQPSTRYRPKVRYHGIRIRGCDPIQLQYEPNLSIQR